MVVVERWLSYKGTCHVILLAKLHDMYLYKTATFPHQPSLFKFLSQRWLSYTGFTVIQNGFNDPNENKNNNCTMVKNV